MCIFYILAQSPVFPRNLIVKWYILILCTGCVIFCGIRLPCFSHVSLLSLSMGIDFVSSFLMLWAMLQQSLVHTADVLKISLLLYTKFHFQSLNRTSFPIWFNLPPPARARTYTPVNLVIHSKCFCCFCWALNSSRIPYKCFLSKYLTIATGPSVLENIRAPP